MVHPRTSQSRRERVLSSPHSRSVPFSPHSASQKVVQGIRKHVPQRQNECLRVAPQRLWESENARAVILFPVQVRPTGKHRSRPG